MDFYLGELLLSMVDLSNIMQTFFQWLDWVSGTFRKVLGSWGPLFISILKLGQVLMDFYLGELLLSMVDLSNIIQTFFQWLDWVSGTFRKVLGSWGPLFISILKLGQVLMDFYLGELLLSMVDLSNIMQTFFQWLDWVSGTFRKVLGSWGPLFISIMKLGQVLMDFYLGELLLSMVDLSTIMQTFFQWLDWVSGTFRKVLGSWGPNLIAILKLGQVLMDFF